MSNLKRCPFCSGEAELEQEKIVGLYTVKCKDCFARIPFQFDFGEGLEVSKEKAIKAWNTRKPMERIVELLNLRRKEYEEASKHPSIELPQECYYKGIMRGYEYSRDIVKEEGGMNE